ncbi:MAG: hypothetical protein ACLR56_01650 [Oscillospiraceae bacterium]
MVGFDNTKYFSRIFRKTGVQPIAYRKSGGKTVFKLFLP